MRGIWDPPWSSEYINLLKLRAVHLALRSLSPLKRHKHVLVRTDSTSAVYYVNHQGCKKKKSPGCLQAWTELLEDNPHPDCGKQGSQHSIWTGPLSGEWRFHPGIVAHIWSDKEQPRSVLLHPGKHAIAWNAAPS